MINVKSLEILVNTLNTRQIADGAAGKFSLQPSINRANTQVILFHLGDGSRPLFTGSVPDCNDFLNGMLTMDQITRSGVPDGAFRPTRDFAAEVTKFAQEHGMVVEPSPLLATLDRVKSTIKVKLKKKGT